MPIAKKSVVKKKSSKLTKKTQVMKITDPTPVVTHLCRSCHALPTGSIELVSLLLVLVFALSAVLVTSVYALNRQAGELAALQGQIAAGE